MTFIIVFGIVAFCIVLIPMLTSAIKDAGIRRTIDRDRKYKGDSQAYSATDMGVGSDHSAGSSSDIGGSDSGGYDSGGIS